jgi:hypothetical protein
LPAAADAELLIATTPAAAENPPPIVAGIDPAFVSAGGGTKVTISLAANSRPLPLPVVYFGAARARLPAEPVVLRLGLDRTERLAGIIARPDGSAEHRFSGSIDLMSAIDALIERACQDPGPCDAERNST